MSLIIEMTEERINEVEDRSIKFTLSVCCPDNRRKLVGKITMNRASETFGTITLAQHLCHWSPRRRREDYRNKKYAKKLWVKTLQIGQKG